MLVRIRENPITVKRFYFTLDFLDFLIFILNRIAIGQQRVYKGC